MAAIRQPVSPQVIGNAFAAQYYHIQHVSPGLVHRFYQDISKLGRPEEDGSMSITTTMQAINEKIVSLNYGDLKAEIKSVDTQESFSGGLHVLVTGYLTSKDNSLRNFVQSFFLAPQDKGYFVLNDMFRYLDNAPVNPALVNYIVVLVPATPEPTPAATAEPAAPEAPAAPAPIQENHVSEHSSPPTEEAVVGEVYNPSENGDVPFVEEEVPVAKALVMPAAPAPIQENHVSEHSSPPTEEAVVGEVYNSSENGDVSFVEEKVPWAEAPVMLAAPAPIQENHVFEHSSPPSLQQKKLLLEKFTIHMRMLMSQLKNAVVSRK